MSVALTDLVERLLESHGRVGGIHNPDGKNLPAKGSIGQIAGRLLQSLFPGFFEGGSLHASEMRIETAALMDDLAEQLEIEIHKSLDYDASALRAKDTPRAAAKRMTFEFLSALPAIRDKLQGDVEAAFEGDPAAKSPEEIVLAYPFIEAIAVQRMAHVLYAKRTPLIPRMLTEWAHARTGMDLHPGASIGARFFIDHGTGTVIGETCEIGDNVKLYHGVTLGARSTSDVEALRGQKRHPSLEDHVTVYPGSTILGGGTVIGKNSTIGGNVFLWDSVPPNSLVLSEGVKVTVRGKKT